VLEKNELTKLIFLLKIVHYSRIIHRDLKPENLLLTVDQHVQIADFGISHMFEEGCDEPYLSDKNASPMFTPPEACDSDTRKLKGKAVDIWGLGVTLFCFVHGHCPFEDYNVLELSHKIMVEEPVYSDKLSPEVRNLLQAMLRKNPEERITLPEIKLHPWVTRNGQVPMSTTEANCAFVDPSEEDVEHALRPAIMFISKVCTILTF
jgi:serine/threonine protein kinase